MPVTLLHTAAGVLDTADQPQFASLSQRLAAGGQKVLLFLHGGLVSQQAGEQQAATLSGSGPHAFGVGPDWEQIYVIWRTDVLSELRTHWLDLVNSDALYVPLLQRLTHHAATKVTLADGRTLAMAAGLTPSEIAARFSSTTGSPIAALEAIAVGPDQVIAAQDTSEDQLRVELRAAINADSSVMAGVEDITAALAPAMTLQLVQGDADRGRRTLGHLNAPVRERIAATTVRAQAALVAPSLSVGEDIVVAAAAILYRCIQRWITHRDHGFYATIVEELARELFGDFIGGGIWNLMKEDAQGHFSADGLGSALVAALSEGRDNRLVVVGHSAGAIWASDFLTAAAGCAQPFPMDMVFIAGADRVRHFAAALGAGGRLVTKFRSFGMLDEVERQDVLIQTPPGLEWVYPSSLLYLVSGLFEMNALPGGGEAPCVDAPLVGMSRFFPDSGVPSWLSGDGPEVAALEVVLAFYANRQPASCYGPCDHGEGLRTSATDHGGFEEDPPTLSSIDFSFLSATAG